MALAKHNDAPASFNRRSLLIAAPAAGVALVAGQAVAEQETPVHRAYLEWKRSLEAWEADMERDDSDENGARWRAATYDLAERAVEAHSEGPMDFIYKLMAYCFDGRHELDLSDGAERIWEEARALIG